MLEITNQVCSEIYDIINHMEKDLISRIPKGFIDLMDKKRDKNYSVDIDYSKSINEQEISRSTRVILSLIYRDYLCDKEKRKFLLEQDNEQLKQIEAELREQYNPDNLFKKRIETTQKEKINETDIIIYKESIFKKLLKKLKFIFKT